MIRPVNQRDSAKIAELYNYYIKKSTATFEEKEISPQEMLHRIKKVIPELPWLVFEDDGEIVGYAYATPWKSRSAYRYSVEVSVYVQHGKGGKGIGSKLYSELINLLIELNFHAIIGGITLPNEASIKLHEKLGFVKVAEFKEVGFKFGKWLNVGYWELTN